MLQLDGVATWYGPAQALFGVDLQVRAGEVVTLLGRNGMGKTTTVMSVMGQAEVRTRTLVGQRTTGIALGYEGLADREQLRYDPVMTILAGTCWRQSYSVPKSTLPSGPSMRRLGLSGRSASAGRMCGSCCVPLPASPATA